MFPQKTYEKMLDIIQRRVPKSHLHAKWNQINSLTDDDKKNRWFGYYQKWGEELGLWNLKDIKDLVREEKASTKKYEKGSIYSSEPKANVEIFLESYSSKPSTKKNISDYGGKHCLTCKGFTNAMMVNHKLWCKIRKERVPAGICSDYDLNTDEYFEDFWESCKHKMIGKTSTCEVKACSLHQSLCIEKCKDYTEL